MLTPNRILRYGVIGASVWYLGAYLAVALLRLRYPFDLEWMEGGSVDHVARILQFQPLYVPPQVSFIPFEYPPLYFYLSAAVAKLVGLGYFPLRLVSLASSLVCFGCIYQIVRDESRRVFPGTLAAGVFAGTFRIGGAWLDLARVDSLFLAFFLVAILMLRESVSARRHALAGLVLALSYLTKQTALAMALPVVLWALLANPRRGVALAASLTAAAGLPTLVLHLASHGWFTFYVWQYPFKHAFALPVWTTFWTRDLLPPLPIAFAGAVLLIVWNLLRFRCSELFWPAVFVGMIGGAYRSRLQTGGYDNVLLPAFAVLAILLGLAVNRLMAVAERRSGLAWRFGEASLYVACLIQMALLWYDPRAQVPTAADRAAGEHLVSVLDNLPGDVLVTHHGYLPMMVGKPSHAHMMQVYDILKVSDEQSAKLADQFRTAIRARTFGAIVLDDAASYFFMQDIDAAYMLQSRVFAEPRVFFPVTGGVIVRPEYIYVPRPIMPAVAGSSAQGRVDEAFRRLRQSAPSESTPAP